MNEELEFYNETCASCVYYYRTPGHITANVCRYWVPTSTAINQFAIMAHVDDAFPACGCYRRNPFLKEEQVAEQVKEDECRETPASEIGEIS